jgi:hypothetical protein
MEARVKALELGMKRMASLGITAFQVQPSPSTQHNRFFFFFPLFFFFSNLPSCGVCRMH